MYSLTTLSKCLKLIRKLGIKAEVLPGNSTSCSPAQTMAHFVGHLLKATDILFCPAPTHSPTAGTMLSRLFSFFPICFDPLAHTKTYRCRHMRFRPVPPSYPLLLPPLLWFPAMVQSSRKCCKDNSQS